MLDNLETRIRKLLKESQKKNKNAYEALYLSGTESAYENVLDLIRALKASQDDLTRG